MKAAASVLYPLIVCLSAGFGAPALADPESAQEDRMGSMQRNDDRDEDQRGPWAAGISDEQRAELVRIKADHLKKQAPLKARMKALKLELIAAALADQPDSAAQDKTIDEMLALKRQLLRNKADKIAAIRTSLNEQQRALYDLHVMKKAARTGRGGGHYRHGEGHGGKGYGMGHGEGHGEGHGMGHGMGHPGMGR